LDNHPLPLVLGPRLCALKPAGPLGSIVCGKKQRAVPSPLRAKLPCVPSFSVTPTVQRIFSFACTTLLEIFGPQQSSCGNCPPVIRRAFLDRLPGFCASKQNILSSPPRNAAGWMGRKVSDRKSTRLNSSHTVISYAVFCLKK